MTHLEHEAMALLALGEPSTPEQAAHLERCERCRAELDELRSAVRVGRETASEERLLEPPPRVWTAVQEELGLARPAPARPRRRLRRRVLPLIGVGLVAAATAAFLLLGTTRTEPPRLIARAELGALPDWAGARGTADLERTADGRLEVHLRIATPDVGRDYRELWLLADGATAAVSLGVVAQDDAVYAVPRGVDLDRYATVDVSREAPDGDPAHSSDSIVRGVLEP